MGIFSSKKGKQKKFLPSLFIFPILLCVLSSCARDQFLTTSDGVKLYYNQESSPAEKGTVVMLHGWGSGYEEWYDLQQYLRKNGWSSIAIDFRGHGGSTQQGDSEIHLRDMKKPDADKFLLDIDTAVKKVGSAKEIWLAGSSLGARYALIHAVNDPGVKGVILLSPAIQFTQEQYGSMMKAYGKRPVFLAASDEDSVPFKGSQAIFDAAQGIKKFVRYHDAGHGAEMLETKKELKSDILSWLESGSRSSSA